MNVYEKVENVRELVSFSLPALGFEDLVRITQRLYNRWQYRKKGKRVEFSKEELKVYEILINNCYNPQTVYKWLLLVKVPNVLKNKLIDSRVSLRATSIYSHVAEKDYLSIKSPLDCSV
jgi:hypothetical protein